MKSFCKNGQTHRKISHLWKTIGLPGFKFTDWYVKRREFSLYLHRDVYLQITRSGIVERNVFDVQFVAVIISAIINDPDFSFW